VHLDGANLKLYKTWALGGEVMSIKPSKDNAYIKRVQNMIRPEDASIISVFGSLLGLAPVRAQKKIMESSTKKNPHMGFVVAPYALFLCHEIVDLEKAQALIPSHFKIVPSRIFADEEPRPYVIFGAFNVQASAFWGGRVEMYVIAQNVQTGLRSWVIVDYDTNSLSFDPGQGFVAPTTSRCGITSTHRGTVVVDVESRSNGRRIAAEADLSRGKLAPLDQTLWLEGNLSVGYGGELSDDRGISFGLLFEPEEMASALRIPVEDVALDALSWHPDVFSAEPSVVACFPYAQHFITSQVPMGAEIKEEAELRKAVDEMNATPEDGGFSSVAIKRSTVIGSAISFLTTTSILLWLILHYAQHH
jgi:hypothetical protein